jgi:hypothetical protein
VTVHRYIIDNTIEDRCVWHRLRFCERETNERLYTSILAIQARKTAMIGAALAGTGSGDKSEALQVRRRSALLSRCSALTWTTTQNLELLFGSS